MTFLVELPNVLYVILSGATAQSKYLNSILYWWDFSTTVEMTFHRYDLSP